MNHNDSGRNIAAIILISLGAFFLLGQVFNFSLLGLLWPFFVILPGAAFLYAAITGNKDKAGLAIPGAMVTGTGLILLYQSITGHWESWAYIWALYPVFLGLGLTFVGRRTQNQSTYSVGNKFVRIGTLVFIAFWVVFEVLIFRGNTPLASTWLPLALIAVGVYLLLRRGSGTAAFRESKKKKVNGYRDSSYNPAEINPELRRQIDEVLMEADEPHPGDN